MTREEVREFNKRLEVTDEELPIYDKLNQIVELIDMLRPILCETTFFERSSFAFNEPTLSENITNVFDDVDDIVQVFNAAMAHLGDLANIKQLASEVEEMFNKLENSRSIN